MPRPTHRRRSANNPASDTRPSPRGAPAQLLVAAVAEVQAVPAVAARLRQRRHGRAAALLLAAAAAARGHRVAALLCQVPRLAADLAGTAGALPHRALLLGDGQERLIVGDGGVEAAGGHDGLRRRLAPRLRGLAPAADGGCVDEGLDTRVGARLLLRDADHVLPHRVSLQRGAAGGRAGGGGGEHGAPCGVEEAARGAPGLPAGPHLVRTRLVDALRTPRVRTVAGLRTQEQEEEGWEQSAGAAARPPASAHQTAAGQPGAAAAGASSLPAATGTHMVARFRSGEGCAARSQVTGFRRLRSAVQRFWRVSGVSCFEEKRGQDF